MVTIKPPISKPQAGGQEQPGKVEPEEIPVADTPDEQITHFKWGTDSDITPIKLECGDTALKVMTTVRPSSSNSYDYIVDYFSCPPGCNDGGEVLGRSIFHPKSQICAAAIVEGSMPIVGGLISVIVLPGQKSYDMYPPVDGVVIGQAEEAAWSFSTLKVNNVDFSKSDVRILDSQGDPSAIGRVEFRVGGRWGTVSKVGTNKDFARQVCRTLLYEDGVIENMDSKCSVYNDKNFCGFDPQPVHYNNYVCKSTDQSLDQCTREVPGTYNHEDDVIIKCLNIDLEKQDNLNPKDKTPSLKNIDGDSINDA